MPIIIFCVLSMLFLGGCAHTDADKPVGTDVQPIDQGTLQRQEAKKTAEEERDRKLNEEAVESIVARIRARMVNNENPAKVKEDLRFLVNNYRATSAFARSAQIQQEVEDYEKTRDAFWASPEGQFERKVREYANSVKIISKSKVEGVTHFGVRGLPSGQPEITAFVLVENGRAQPYLRFIYNAKNWLFMDEAKVLCGSRKFTFKWRYADVVRSAFSGGIVEYYSASAVGNYRELGSCISDLSEEVYVRYEGKEHYHEYKLNSATQKKVKIMLEFASDYKKLPKDWQSKQEKPKW